MKNTINTIDTINNFDDLGDALSIVMVKLINGEMDAARAREVISAAWKRIRIVLTQLEYVKVMAKKPEGDFCDLFKTKTETPRTTGGNGNGKRKTAKRFTS